MQLNDAQLPRTSTMH